MSEYMDSVTSQDISFNRNIEMRDLEGNTKNICSCYCTIKAGENCSYYFQVNEQEIFKVHKDKIQLEIDKFVIEARELANKYNVPVF